MVSDLDLSSNRIRQIDPYFFNKEILFRSTILFRPLKQKIMVLNNLPICIAYKVYKIFLQLIIVLMIYLIQKKSQSFKIYAICNYITVHQLGDQVIDKQFSKGFLNYVTWMVKKLSKKKEIELTLLRIFNHNYHYSQIRIHCL